jgi:hypothetical protein
MKQSEQYQPVYHNDYRTFRASDGVILLVGYGQDH